MSELAFYEEAAQMPGLAESPVLPSLCSTMNVDLVVNPNSSVWLIHDRPFPLGLIWAEYDADTASLYLVARDGKIIDLGMKIFPDTRKYLRHARQLFTMRMKDGDVDDSYILPLLVRETRNYKA